MSLILNDPELFAEWKRDIQTMSGRIIAMRKELHRLLTEVHKTPGNWDHILNQIGMFRCVNGDLECPQETDEVAQLHWAECRAEQGHGGKGAHLHDWQRADFDGGTQQPQCRVCCGKPG